MAQFDLSARRSTQDEPQADIGAVQAQTPDAHVWLDPQDTPHPPQFFVSSEGSTQSPPSQSSAPRGQGPPSPSATSCSVSEYPAIASHPAQQSPAPATASANASAST